MVVNDCLKRKLIESLCAKLNSTGVALGFVTVDPAIADYKSIRPSSSIPGELASDVPRWCRAASAAPQRPFWWSF
jgi:hypothetical protein